MASRWCSSLRAVTTRAVGRAGDLAEIVPSRGAARVRRVGGVDEEPVQVGIALGVRVLELHGEVMPLGVRRRGHDEATPRAAREVARLRLVRRHRLRRDAYRLRLTQVAGPSGLAHGGEGIVARALV